ncbi:MAG: hypothetical protein ACOVQY_00610 [Erythrobacter sp.]|jgi:hypothetical protein
MIRISPRSRLWSACVAGALVMAASLPVAAQSASGQPDLETESAQTPAPTKGELRLAKMLEGRVAGEPVICIRAFPSQRMQTIDGVAYVYGSGNTIYVQRTRNPDAIDDTDALVVTRTNGTQLCRFDIATTVDAVNGFFTGAVMFEDFVPYTRVKPGTTGEG